MPRATGREAGSGPGGRAPGNFLTLHRAAKEIVKAEAGGHAARPSCKTKGGGSYGRQVTQGHQAGQWASQPQRRGRRPRLPGDPQAPAWVWLQAPRRP